MVRKSMLVVGVLVVAFGVLVWGCSPRSTGGAQEIKLAVTDRGFEPAEIQVEKGEPVTLLVTRTVEATCVHEIVLADFGVRKALPLNEEVRITLTPEQTGEFRYICPMDMIGGTMTVR